MMFSTPLVLILREQRDERAADGVSVRPGSQETPGRQQILDVSDFPGR
jgi:hypothetical protein